MDSHLIDMNGRLGFKKRFPYIYRGYWHIGSNIDDLKGIEHIVPLRKSRSYDLPLHPQQTVVQLNSTYLETIGRNDRRRGDAVVVSGALAGLGIYMLSGSIYFISASLVKGVYWFSLFITLMAVLIGIVTFLMLFAVSTEVFTSRHYPVRFNRKTRKVYVRQYNKKVEVFDWSDIHFYIFYMKEDADIRGVKFAADGKTIEAMFALPFHIKDSEEELIQHFAFFTSYMSKNEKRFLQAKDAVRYVYPIHKYRETPVQSLERIKLEFHFDHMNMEYPKETVMPKYIFAIFTPMIAIRYVGRLISMLTCYRHRFAEAIEAECEIDTNDPYDLNKNLPEGNLEQNNQPLWKTVINIVMFIGALILLLFVGAFMIDMVGVMRPHGDYPSMVDKLWYVVSLGWLS